MRNPRRAIKQILLQLRWPALQSLVNQHHQLPKLRINQQPRARSLNAAESPLGAAVAAGVTEAAAVEVLEVAD